MLAGLHVAPLTDLLMGPLLSPLLSPRIGPSIAQPR